MLRRKAIPHWLLGGEEKKKERKKKNENRFKIRRKTTPKNTDKTEKNGEAYSD